MIRYKKVKGKIRERRGKFEIGYMREQKREGSGKRREGTGKEDRGCRIKKESSRVEFITIK
jgi:hypothetical protein